MFASENSCWGDSKSRRDDIESIIYLMIYLINGNVLPWSFLHSSSRPLNIKLKERISIQYRERLYMAVDGILFLLLNSYSLIS